MTPVIDRIGLEGYVVEEQVCNQQTVHLTVRLKDSLARPQACPYCGAGSSRLHSKGRYQRRVRHLDCFGLEVYLHVRTRRFVCRDCGRSFLPVLPGIMSGRHSSEPFRQHLFRQHDAGVCVSKLSDILGVGHATCERIYQQFTQRKARERTRLECPVYLGIDEHVLHRGGRYVTTFCDLKNHKIVDLAYGRSESEIRSFLTQLVGREKVKVVCMDMSGPYRAMVRKWFPNAKIVSDRFHAVRIVMHHFLDLARELVPQLKNKGGYLIALRKRPENLTTLQRERLLQLFKDYPALRPLYEKMRQICELLNLKSQSAQSCRKHGRKLFRFIDELKDSGFKQLMTLARTLQSWSEPLARMWRFTKNNSITEGFHRKMKLIQRRAYGFRNFNNYRLRVIAQCG